MRALAPDARPDEWTIDETGCRVALAEHSQDGTQKPMLIMD